MAKSVDAPDLGSGALCVRVRVSLPAPLSLQHGSNKRRGAAFMQLFLYLDYKFRFLDSLRLSYVSLLDYRLF